METPHSDQALSILETVREEDCGGTDSCVRQLGGKWVREEAVVDSGAVECVTSRKRMPHWRVEETAESRRRQTWTCTCTGGNEIKHEDRVTVNWRSDLGTVQRGVFKVGAVSRPQISVNRLQETSHDVILTKNHPHVDNMKTVKIMPLRKHGGMFILDMWIWVPSRSKTESSEQGITMLVKGAQFLGSILTRVAGGFDLAVKPGLPRVIAQDAGRDHGGKTTALVTNATVDPFQVLYTGGPSPLLRQAETQPVIWSDPAHRRKHAHVEEAGQRSLGND